MITVGQRIKHLLTSYTRNSTVQSIRQFYNIQLHELARRDHDEGNNRIKILSMSCILLRFGICSI